MTTFDKREKAFEEKFFHDEEMKFKVISRRRKFLGLWAAEQMHMDEEDSLKYSLELVRESAVSRDEDTIINKICEDMKNAGLEISEDEIREKIESMHLKAKQRIEDEYR